MTDAELLADLLKAKQIEFETFYFELLDVMEIIDKWLDSDELTLGKVQRANCMSEKVSRIIEEKDEEIMKLKRQLTIQNEVKE